MMYKKCRPYSVYHIGRFFSNQRIKASHEKDSKK